MGVIKGERSIEIDAPAERCYDIVADVERTPAWAKPLKSLEVLERDSEQRAVLIDQSQAYAVGLAEEFTKNFQKMEGTIVTSQSYNRGDADFTARLTAIRPDCSIRSPAL